ncbi:MAG: hypothetical protein VW551_05750 [Euryarchaeota archaeon]|jgi:hypothetical protein
MGIYARHLGEWYRVDEGGSAGELPGLGGWITITDVKGKGNKYSYTDADGDWVAYEWTNAGSVTTTKGLLDALIVGGGMGYMSNLNGPGGGGSIVTNIIEITDGNHAIEIGVGKPAGSNFEQYTGTPTSVGPIHTGYSYSAGFSYAGTTVQNVPERGEPYPSSITGLSETYAGGRKNSTTRLGDGGVNSGNSGRNGVAIIRVPKANDGRSDIASSAAGVPFDIPTARETIVQALEEKVEEAREAVRDRRNERRKRR